MMSTKSNKSLSAELDRMIAEVNKLKAIRASVLNEIDRASMPHRKMLSK
ncbi:hypothetical protein [Eisenibacter elegans]|jgi:hypothetical protein|nr:hypothetical protein [Eisenibacter elegans]